MIHGLFQDRVYDHHNVLLWDRNWSPNTIVESAWPLVAGLLKNDPALSGILYLAVGAGDPSWDGTGMRGNPAATRLHAEMSRQRLAEDAIVYLNPDGTPAESPTNSIEITANFHWPVEKQTLREFGLFGGNATDLAGSGFLINYVIHPSIELEAGSTLRRRSRLSLRPFAVREWLEIPHHWFETIELRNLDGVGNTNVASLNAAGIRTIGELAQSDVSKLEKGISFTNLVELRAKARLAIRTAGDILPIPELVDMPVWDFVVTPVGTLAEQTGVSMETLQVVQEKISVLQLTLDNRFLKRLTLKTLFQGA